MRPLLLQELVSPEHGVEFKFPHTSLGPVIALESFDRMIDNRARLGRFDTNIGCNLPTVVEG